MLKVLNILVRKKTSGLSFYINSIINMLIKLTNSRLLSNLRTLIENLLQVLIVFFPEKSLMIIYKLICNESCTYKQILIILKSLAEGAFELSNPISYKENSNLKIRNIDKKNNNKKILDVLELHYMKNRKFLINYNHVIKDSFTKKIGDTNKKIKLEINTKLNQFWIFSTNFFYPLINRIIFDLSKFKNFKNHISRIVWTLSIFIECSGNSIKTEQLIKDGLRLIFFLYHDERREIRLSCLFFISRVIFQLTHINLYTALNKQVQSILDWLIYVNKNEIYPPANYLTFFCLEKIKGLLKRLDTKSF